MAGISQIQAVSPVKAGRLAVLLLCLLLAACASRVPAPRVERTALANYPVIPDPVPNGAIYQPGRAFMPLFEDRRPRRVGDIITIVLNEQVSASKNSASNAHRDSAAVLDLAALPDALETLAEYGFDVSGSSEFTSGGGSTANNTFTGTITVTVQQVMPNGNLWVEGEKQIAINQGTEYIRFSGIVFPRSINERNAVASVEVAEARIEYLGGGYINRSQQMGWLQRFFLSVSPF